MQGKGEVGYATVGEYLSPVLDSIARSINSDDHANGKGLANSIAILVVGSKSGFDRSLPRGFHPVPPGNNVTTNFVQRTNETAITQQDLNETTAPLGGTNAIESS